MSLTGGPFLVAIVVLTVLAFAAVVWLWPRFAATRPVDLLARVGMLLGVNALVLLVAATSLNDTYQFYADWTDLLGGGAVTGSAISTAHGGGAASGAFASRPDVPGSVGSPALPPLPPGLDRSHRVARFFVAGLRSGLTSPVLVELPASYFDPHQAHRRYPVLEALHGHPGSPGQWTRTMPLASDLAAGAAAERNGDAIVVSPETEVPHGRDGECVNGPPGTAQIETWLAQDVPNWVQQTFRVATDRRSWATVGLSSGGWCAAMMTMLHPDRFSAAIVLGGYFRPIFGSYRPLAHDRSRGLRYDLVRLAGTAPPPVAIWLESSVADRVSFPSSRLLLKAARAPLSVSATVLRHAGHRISLWQAILPTSLDWLGRTDPGFRPVGSRG